MPMYIYAVIQTRECEVDGNDWICNRKRKKIPPSIADFHELRAGSARTLHEPTITLPLFGRTGNHRDVHEPAKG